MSKETTKKRSQSAKSKTQTRKKSSSKVKAKAKANAKAKARQRQKKKLMVLIGLVAVLVLLIAVSLLVSNVMGEKVADDNSIYILEDNKIVSTNVETFGDNYDTKELKSFMNDIIKEYNKENGSGSVKQKSFQLKNGVATSVLQYRDADVFEEFYGRELFVGTVGEAIQAGYSFDIPFAKVKGTVKEVTSADFLTDNTYKVAIIRANTKVMVEGEICYISTENIAEFGSDYVVIKEGAYEDGALAEMEAMENTECTENTEAVDDDDLLEEGGLVFDFGEEEIKETEYSETYTYIIYK